MDKYHREIEIYSDYIKSAHFSVKDNSIHFRIIMMITMGLAMLSVVCFVIWFIRLMKNRSSKREDRQKDYDRFDSS